MKPASVLGLSGKDFVKVTLSMLACLALIGAAAQAADGEERQFWRGKYEGEFIGDTSGAKAASVLLPTIRISFVIRIAGHVTPSGSFEGRYEALFEPSIKAIALEKADEVERWEVKPEDSVAAQGRVTGLGPFRIDPDTRKFMQNVLEAVSKALEAWKGSPLVKNGTLNGMQGTIPPGGLSGGPGAELIKSIVATVAGEDYPSRKGEYDALCDGFAKAFGDYLAGYTAALKCPPAAVVSGPALTGAQTVPLPFASGTSSSSVTAKSILDAAASSGGAGGGSGTKSRMELTAEALGAAMTIFAASNMITSVMCSGPVPTYAPPNVPVGPVVGGTMSGGSLTGPALNPGVLDGMGGPEKMRFVFHGIPERIAISIKQTINWAEAGRKFKSEAKTALGNGYFCPEALTYRRCFEGTVAEKDGKQVCEADIDDSREKPSPLKDGMLREIGRTRLSMLRENPASKLDPGTLAALGLGPDGLPPAHPDGGYKAPSGDSYGGFAFMENLCPAGGSDPGAAGGGPTETASARGPAGEDLAVFFFNPGKAPPQECGLCMLVEADARAGIRISDGGQAFTAVVDGKPAAGLPGAFGHVSAGMHRFYLPLSGSYRIESQRGANAVRIVIPSSPWTRRTHSLTLPGTGRASVSVDSAQGIGNLEGAVVETTEDADGRYKARKIVPAEAKVAPAAEPKAGKGAPGDSGADPKAKPVPPENPKDAGKKDEDMPIDKYCEMTGKLILAMSPLIVALRKELDGKTVPEKIRIGEEYQKRIDAAIAPIYQEYGVSRELADKAGKKKKYTEAFRDYMEKHPDVKAAFESAKR